jgi:hypothetical protein
MGNVGGVLTGLYGLVKALVTWDGALARESAVNLFGASVMLRSGSTGGLAHPSASSIRTPDPGTKNHNAFVNHDAAMRDGRWLDSAAHFQLVHDMWVGPGREMGPWGQAYRAYATVGLGTWGAILKGFGQ